MLTIRAATVADCGLLVSFIKELAEFEKLSHQVVATEELLRQTLFVSGSSAEAIIGEVEGKPVAFALFFRNFSTFLGCPGLYLEDLFVKPDVRGKGYGEQMLSHLAKIACDRGYGRMEWSVLDWNEKAIQFYDRLGAKPLDEWIVYRLSREGMAELAAKGEARVDQS